MHIASLIFHRYTGLEIAQEVKKCHNPPMDDFPIPEYIYDTTTDSVCYLPEMSEFLNAIQNCEEPDVKEYILISIGFTDNVMAEEISLQCADIFIESLCINAEFLKTYKPYIYINTERSHMPIETVFVFDFIDQSGWTDCGYEYDYACELKGILNRSDLKMIEIK